jgi:hypothetical protein
MEFIRRRREDLGAATNSARRIVAPPVENPSSPEQYEEEESIRDNIMSTQKYDYNDSRAKPLRPLSNEELNKPKVRDLLKQLVEEKQIGEQQKETKKFKKKFKYPMKWKSKANKSSRKPDTVLVFYLNIKGEIQTPMVVPIYSGNMVIIRNKIHEVDPRAMWSLKLGMKTHKVLIIKEIDRRPVSNLDLDEIRRRGDATDSDEFLIKAALRAQTAVAKKPIPIWIWIILGIVVIGLLAFFFLSGNKTAPIVTPTG